MRAVLLGLAVLAALVLGWSFFSKQPEPGPQVPESQAVATQQPDGEPGGAVSFSAKTAASRDNAAEQASSPPDPFTWRSVYPRRPMEVVAAMTTKAEQDDAVAQWQLFLAFDECAFAPQNEAALQRAIHQVDDPLFQQDQRWRFERCRELFAQYPEPAQEARKWQRRAVINGYPPALLDVAMLSVPQTVDELPDAVIVAALLTGEARVFRNVAMLTSRLPEPERSVRADVWSLLECRANEGCRVDAMVDYLRSKWLPHERDRIVDAADQIEAAIETGNLNGVAVP